MGKLGLVPGSVKIVPYDTTWTKKFLREKQQITELQSPHIIQVEHIGSTSVPGMPAKPIIDIVIGVDKYSSVKQLIKPLSTIGYEYRFESRKFQSFFLKQQNGRHTHYLKVVRYGGNYWRAFVQFKNRLTKNKRYFKLYKTAKIELEKRYLNDRELYTKNKHKVIKKILN